MVARYNTGNAPFIGGLVMGYGPREILPRETFEGVVNVSFEGESFKAMAGWDRYLKALYGDYMTPPPPEKRLVKHSFKAWWKDGTDKMV